MLLTEAMRNILKIAYVNGAYVSYRRLSDEYMPMITGGLAFYVGGSTEGRLILTLRGTRYAGSIFYNWTDPVV